MKKVRVLYRDDPTYSGGGRDFEYTTARAYSPTEAKQVAENLATMGCHSIRFVPDKEAA